MADITSKIKTQVSLKDYCTFRIGGAADFLFEAESDADVADVVRHCAAANIPFIIIGGGSNILCADEGYRGMAIVLRNAALYFDGSRVSCDAGVSWGELLRAAAEHSLSGLEWGADIPGTVGGAVRGNAGAYGGEVKDTIVSVRVLRNGSIMEIPAGECGFAYRESAFKTNGDIILGATFILFHGDRAAIASAMRDITEKRRAKLPSEPSAGSDFKNVLVTDENRDRLIAAGAPQDYLDRGKVPAGWLSQQLGLPGMRIGGAQISEKHGNIIINTGGATASDVLQLLSLVKMKVRDVYGIQLQEEIQYIS